MSILPVPAHPYLALTEEQKDIIIRNITEAYLKGMTYKRSTAGELARQNIMAGAMARKLIKELEATRVN